MIDTSSSEAALWREAIDLIVEPPSIAEGLAALAEVLRRRFAVASCAVHLQDQGTEELVLQAVAGDHQGIEERLRLGQGVTGLAACHARPIQVARPYPALPGARQGAVTRSLAAAPFWDHGQLLGVCTLCDAEGRAFSAAEMSVLEHAVPRLLTALIREAQRQEMLQRRTSEVQALNELGQAMNSGLGLDETLELIAARAAEALSAKGSAVRLVVEDGTLAMATMVTDAETPFDTRYEKRIAEFVAATGEPIVIDDVRAIRDLGAGGSSALCVPLVVEERVVGTLALFDKVEAGGRRKRLFDLDDLNMLFALSSQIAAKIDDIRLTVRLQDLVRTEKQQGEELRVLYNRSQALLQSISDGLLAIDRDGTVAEANTVARRVFGWAERSVPLPAIDDLVEDKPPLHEWLDTGGQFSNRVISLRTANGRIAALANLQPILDAGRRSLGAVLTFREMGEVGRLVNRVIGTQRTFVFDDIVGGSAAIEKTKELARIAAGTTSNILIQGETGTGKEVFAQAIHNASAFSEGPFLAVNCAAIPRDLIESELFGYVEGAFTGASKKGRLGKFELASGGSLFLDEIGDIPLEVQVKLLRVLQEKSIVRVGGDHTIPISCRLMAATNRDLQRAVEEGKFRRDLLYRLNVITLEIPPLRERQGDIPLFVDRFVRSFAERNAKVVSEVEDEVTARLVEYPWPGNVRELENAIEHAVAMVKGRVIGWDDLPARLREELKRTPGPGVEKLGAFERAQWDHGESVKKVILEALRAQGGDVVAAAQLLGVSRATLYRRLRRLGLQSEVVKMRYQSHFRA